MFFKKFFDDQKELNKLYIDSQLNIIKQDFEETLDMLIAGMERLEKKINENNN